MKKLIAIAALALTASCQALGGSPGIVEVANGPVARTIERVLVRTEGYMGMQEPPVAVPEEAQGPVAASIVVARQMLSQQTASGDILRVTMAPIMDIHDMMVTYDQDLDMLEREIYLEDTARLRALFDAAAIYAAASPAAVE